MLNDLRKYTYLILGSLFLLIGIVGTFLPVIPTTPLIVLACYLYSKSSPKFQTWLMGTKIYNDYAKDFIEHRRLPIKKKIVLVSFASLMLLFPLFLLDGLMKLLIISLYLILYYYFIFQIETIR